MRRALLFALVLVTLPARSAPFDDVQCLPNPSTSGNVLTSNGTDWTSAAPGTPSSDAVRPSSMGLAVRNTTGGTLAVGTLVYVSSWNAANSLPLVSKADADASGAIAAYVIDTAILNNANGVVGRTYLLTGIDTSGFSAVGSAAYLDTTAGGYTATAPTAGNARVQPVGQVTVKDATVGAIQFDLQSQQTRSWGSNELQATAVSAGSYTYSAITVDAAGRLTAASSGAAPVSLQASSPGSADTGNINVSGTMLSGLVRSGTGAAPYPALSLDTIAATAMSGTTTANVTSKIVGSSTLFTTEIAVGDDICVGGSACSAVLGITDNTHLTVQAAVGDGSSQAMTRKRAIARFYDTAASSAAWGAYTTEGPIWLRDGNGSDIHPNVLGAANPGFLGLARYNTSFASPTAMSAGNALGQIRFDGFNGTYLGTGASFFGYAGSTWTTSNTEGYLSFAVTANGSTSVTEGMRLQSTGALTLNASQNKGTCTLDGGTPSHCTVAPTVTSGATCVCSPVGTTAVIAAGGCAASLSGTTLTLTSFATSVGSANYLCF